MYDGMNMPKLLLVPVLVVSCLFGSCNGKKDDTQQPKSEPDYSIAYNVLIDDETENYEVFTMDLDGANKRNVTNLDGVEWSYASAGSRLFFISDKDTCRRCYFLYTSDYLGREATKVSDLRVADSWMSFRKNGTEVIVNPHSSNDSAFHIIDLQGKLIQRLETGLAAATDPLFISEGQVVAFRGGTRKSKKEDGYEEEIYLINVDGTGLKQLSHYPPSDTTAPWFAYKAGPPHLHPTENFISYASYQNGKYSLYGVSLDGQNQWKLTENDLWEVYHDWSPDGRWLVTDVSNAEETHYDIGLINWGTKELKILTDASYQYQQSPSFVLKK